LHPDRTIRQGGFFSIGTISFYNFIIISKYLNIVKKKQGLAANTISLERAKIR
jgi:hypothetical protein